MREPATSHLFSASSNIILTQSTRVTTPRTMSSKVLLLYGSGARVGAAVLQKFASNGWKTAAVVRTMKNEYKKSADLVFQADFTNAEAIQKIYSEVETKLGTPKCVVYNGMNRRRLVVVQREAANLTTLAYALESAVNDPTKPFAASPDKFATDMAINTVGCYAAASSAAAGFAKLSSGPKVFIYTGNGLPTTIIPELPGLGAGKAAAAYLIETAANALKDDSHWYFADERFADGKAVMSYLSGEAHSEAFYELAMRKSQGPWNYTFVKGKGYLKCSDTVDHAFITQAELFANLGK